MANGTARILLVDDEQSIQTLLSYPLRKDGYHVTSALDGGEALQRFEEGRFDLVILDLMLPGEDGLAICRRLRGQGVETPIVMLTAKGDEVDRIVGLELGADDYLPKPGNPRELVARMRAVLRRGRPAIGAPRADGGEVRFGRCTLDLATRRLCRDGAPQRLTSGEFAVLAALVARPHQTLTRDQLMSLARGRAHDACERSIDVMLSRLRKLVETDPHAPRYLQTIWGAGYVFVPDDTGP